MAWPARWWSPFCGWSWRSATANTSPAYSSRGPSSEGGTGSSAGFSGLPLFGGDLPDFRREAACDIVAFAGPHHAHTLPLRNAPRALVGDQLGRAQHRLVRHTDPVVGHRSAAFAHKAPTAPPGIEP